MSIGSIRGRWSGAHSISGFLGCIALLAILTTTAASAAAQRFQLISTLDPSQGPPAGGSGDSVAPILSPDGRYVLFASTANNLVLTSNNLPLPAPFPATLNVFLHDRTNGTTTLMSANLLGTGGGNGNSIPAAISTNGNYVLFESTATNLVPADTNKAADVFVRDVLNGTTLLVSVATNGGKANGASSSSVMTPEGRYVAFVSAANNLVPGDTNGIADVFVRDLVSGVTTVASVGAKSAALPANSGLQICSSEAPDLTPDGRYVAFFSAATNLVPGVSSVGDIYVRDLVGGTTVWASSGARAVVQSVMGAANAICFNHSLSTNGQIVAYEAKPILASGYSITGVVLRYNAQSGLTDRVNTNAPAPTSAYEDTRSLAMSPDGRYVAFIAYANGTSGSTTCLDVWDADTGLTVLASRDLSNNVPVNSICDWPMIDSSGRTVAFLSSATNLVTDSLVGEYHLYVRDLVAGVTSLVDADTNGVGATVNPASAPSLSADGRFVAFECFDGGLVPNDRNRDFDVFVRDLHTNSTELISARAAPLASVSPNGPSLLSTLSVSTNGRYVVFASDADNLVPADTNGFRDIFVRDLLLGTNILVSAGTNGVAADAPSTEPAISGGGRYVVFTSGADNLIPGDTNKVSDVFLRDLQNGTTVLVSASFSGSGPGNGLSYSPTISTDGRYVFYRSQALNLAAGSFNAGYENLVVRDMALGTNYVLTLTGSGSPVGAMSPNGPFIAYFGQRAGYPIALCLWDCQSARLIYSNVLSGITSVLASQDGNRIAYVTSTGPSLYALDRPSTTGSLIATGVATSRPGLRFSDDGRFLTYVSKSQSPATNRVYLYDFQAGTNTTVSRSYQPAAQTDDVSDSPDITRDGRFIAYRSAAGNIVPGDTNGFPDIFLYDRVTHATALLSASVSGNAAADNRSLTPVFSADGHTLLIQSWASDIVAQDFNHGSDILAYNLYSSGEIPLFVAAIASGTAVTGPWITWPVAAGKSYRVEFKDSLSEPGWQDLNGGVIILGSQGYLNDPSAGPGPRFYRVVAY